MDTVTAVNAEVHPSVSLVECGQEESSVMEYTSGMYHLLIELHLFKLEYQFVMKYARNSTKLR